MTDEQSQEAPEFPTAWRPDKDDPKTIKGRVASVAMGPDFGFGSYPIVTLIDETGAERAVHAMHHILRTELARRRPGAGDEVEITYLGKRAPKSGNGNPFHVYRVAGGKEPEFNWEAELPEEERRSFQQTPPAPLPAAVTGPQVPSAYDPDVDDDVPF